MPIQNIIIIVIAPPKKACGLTCDNPSRNGFLKSINFDCIVSYLLTFETFLVEENAIKYRSVVFVQILSCLSYPLVSSFEEHIGKGYRNKLTKGKESHVQ